MGLYSGLFSAFRQGRRLRVVQTTVRLFILLPVIYDACIYTPKNASRPGSLGSGMCLNHILFL